MKTFIKVKKSNKTGKNYFCLEVGSTIVFLDMMQIMKILNMNPHEIAIVLSQEGFVYDINEERRID